MPRGITLELDAPVRESILALDPGSAETGWVMLSEARPFAHGTTPNQQLLRWLAGPADLTPWLVAPGTVVIEWTAPRGMLASEQLFETMWWAGRFRQAITTRVVRLERLKIKRHLTGKTNTKDMHVRQALIDRYGGTGGKDAAIGRKATPGPLFGISGDAWAALAIAVTYLDDPGLAIAETPS